MKIGKFGNMKILNTPLDSCSRSKFLQNHLLAFVFLLFAISGPCTFFFYSFISCVFFALRIPLQNPFYIQNCEQRNWRPKKKEKKKETGCDFSASLIMLWKWCWKLCAGRGHVQIVHVSEKRYASSLNFHPFLGWTCGAVHFAPPFFGKIYARHKRGHRTLLFTQHLTIENWQTAMNNSVVIVQWPTPSRCWRKLERFTIFDEVGGGRVEGARADRANPSTISLSDGYKRKNGKRCRWCPVPRRCNIKKKKRSSRYWYECIVKVKPKAIRFFQLSLFFELINYHRSRFVFW